MMSASMVSLSAARPTVSVRAGGGSRPRDAISATAVQSTRRSRVTALPPPSLPSLNGSQRRMVVARAEAEDKASSAGTVIMPGDYRIGGTLLSVSFLLGPLAHLWSPFFWHALLGGFLTFQSSRVRFRFTDTDLQVVFIEPFGSDDEALTAGVDSSGDNKLQGGGENSWPLASITNWEFWWPGFPVLVYFKENATKPEGQPHFFPIIMDGKKLYETMLERMPESKNKKVSPEEWNLQTALEATPVGRNILEQLNEEQKSSVKGITKLPVIDK